MTNLKKAYKVTILVIVDTFFCFNITFATITSDFGWRTHPIYGDTRFHSGVDLGYEYNTPIGAIFAGKIVYADWWGGYGNCVIIDHGNNIYTLYGHLNQINVYENDLVNQGEVIGLVGSTGDSTGPHLHLEYWVNGEYVDPVQIL